jgi:phosphate transport system substrate-binding protein
MVKHNNGKCPCEQSYPSYVYDFVFKEMSSNPNINEAKARALVDFITWTITDGQQFGPDLGYVPLPENVVSMNQQTLKSLTFNGQPVSAAPLAFTFVTAY